MSPITDGEEFATASAVIEKLVSDAKSMLGEEDGALFSFLSETILLEGDNEISEGDMTSHVRRLVRDRIQSPEDLGQ